MERLSLLVSDVDHTLLGNDASLEEFVAWHGDHRSMLKLAYNSGRFFHQVLESTRETRLPVPDAIIGGVGSEISFPPEGDRLADWPIVNGRWDPEVVVGVLSAQRGLTRQPEMFQSEYKVSYFGENLSEEYLSRLREQFMDAGCEVSMVYSSALHLDILPAGANKGSAIWPLAAHWEIDPADVIVAGDSGNDLEMFRQGFRGIVVGNAQPELKEFTGVNVYHASRGYAAGVLEGLKYWL